MQSVACAVRKAPDYYGLAVVNRPTTVEKGKADDAHGGSDHQSEAADRHVDPKGVQQDTEEDDDEPGKRLGRLYRLLNSVEAHPVHSDPPCFRFRTWHPQQHCLNEHGGNRSPPLRYLHLIVIKRLIDLYTVYCKYNECCVLK